MTLAFVTALALLATLLTVPPPSAAAQPGSLLDGPRRKAVPARAGKRVPIPPDPARQSALGSAPTAAWPRPGAAVVDLEQGARGSARAGSLPVTLARAGNQEAASVRQARVEVLDREAASRIGLTGLALQVVRADGGARPGSVTVEVDYSGFAQSFGGGHASRLRLVRLPACARTTPRRPGCTVPTTVPSRNDLARGRLSAEVSADPAPAGTLGERAGDGAQIYAVTAGDAGSGGDYAATPLAPAGTWQAGTPSGDFAWSYALRMPPALGGPAPELNLGYSSGSVDGRTTAANSQTSWVGEGWDLSQGFVERTYGSCVDDGWRAQGYGDLCWRSDNAALNLNGRTVQLIRDKATGAWRAKFDEGYRIERRTDTQNADDNHEYWVVTSPDGTKYYFGVNNRGGNTGNAYTQSTWTVPVYGDDPGEPCYKGSNFAGNVCWQAWRWNLDYIVDPNQNTMSYFYVPEYNWYSPMRDTGRGYQYTRGGYLGRIDYGQRKGQEGADWRAAPMQVVFNAAERCLPDAAFDCAEDKLNAGTASRWPDVPWDLNCSNFNCTNRFAPTFWTRKRLAGVTTKVRDPATGEQRPVDEWRFTHLFNGDPTDGRALWLDKIEHIGHVGGSANDATVDFDGAFMDNRVDHNVGAGVSRLRRFRMTGIDNGMGGYVRVTYAGMDCSSTSLPTGNADRNKRRCFPQWWAPDGGTPGFGWFHKYIVTKVEEVDRVGGSEAVSPTQVTTFGYGLTENDADDALWHYTTEPFVPAAQRTWDDWRGYSRVTVTAGAPGEPQSHSVHLYFRGMNGDNLAGTTAKRDVKITDSEGGVHADAEVLQGMLLDEAHYDRPGGRPLAGAVYGTWVSGVLASDPAYGNAHIVRTNRVRERELLPDTGGWRRGEIRTDFDTYGLATRVNDLGDPADAADDRCTVTQYARNTAAWLIEYPGRVLEYGKSCAANLTNADVISGSESLYDGSTDVLAAPTAGLPTSIRELTGFDDSGNGQYASLGRTTYDPYGRPIEHVDPQDRRSTTRYTPATGPVTRVDSTNTLGHTEVAYMEPAWGLALAEIDANGKRTDMAYDPLGRLTRTWLPGRSRETGQSPSTEFRYVVGGAGANVVQSRRLRSEGVYVETHSFHDGWGRLRYTEQAAPGGGRIVAEQRYDSRGLETRATGPFWNGTARGWDDPAPPVLEVFDNASIPSQRTMTYDGLERQTTAALVSFGAEKWRTTVTYGGDHVAIDPPEGQTPSRVSLDSRDRVVELRQYRGPSPTGEHDLTRYTHTQRDELASVTDPGGNIWRSHYDLRGRLVRSEDPDRGATTFRYDDDDQLVSTTDSRGATLAFGYDALGRKTGEYAGSISGTKLAEWVYDTLAKGVLTKSVRHDGGQSYTDEVTGYDDGYRPTGRAITVPAKEGALAGNYRYGYTYDLAGDLTSTSAPAAGGLPAETIRHGYDRLGYLKSTTGLSTYVSGAEHNEIGQLSGFVNGSGDKTVERAFGYDPATRRTTSIRAATLAGDRRTMVQDARYSHDPAGNVLRVTDNAITESQCFDYDHLRRMTQAWSVAASSGQAACATAPSAATVGGPAPYWTQHSYDQLGNRVAQTDRLAGITSTYEYAAAGQSQPHGLRSVVTKSAQGERVERYAADAAGNTTSRMLQGSTQSLTWDDDGKLARVEESAGATTFAYDVDGERIVRRDPQGATLYLDGQEIRLDKATGALKATRYYDHGGTTVAVRATGEPITWLAGDHQGTAQLAIADGSLAVDRRFYTPFGESRQRPADWPTERGFLNATQDPSTGLINMGAREYDAATGRFLSTDPLMDPANPQTFNAFAYAGNSPVTFSDPGGLVYAPEDGDGGGGVSAGLGGGGGGGKKAKSRSGMGGGKVRAGLGGGSRSRPRAWLTRVSDEEPDPPKQMAPGSPSAPPCLLRDECKHDLPNPGWKDVKEIIELCGYIFMLCGVADVIAKAIEKKWKEALWALVGVIPFAKLLKGGVKVIGKLAKWFGKRRKIADAAGHAAPGRRAVPNSPPSGRPPPVRPPTRPKVPAPRRPGGKNPSPSRSTDQNAGSSCRASSFVPGTEVVLADRTRKRIQDVRLGDTVLATDPRDGATGGHEVVGVITGQGGRVLVEIGVEIGGGADRTRAVLNATVNHPFWVRDTGTWVPAGELRPGMWLRTSTGDEARVTAVESRWVPGQRVHNLTIEGKRTYHVAAGRAGILVHNCPPLEIGGGKRYGPNPDDLEAGTIQRGTEMEHPDWEKGDPIFTWVPAFPNESHKQRRRRITANLLNLVRFIADRLT